MAFIKEAYSESRVEMIYELLKQEAENGAPKEYDVKIDELKVVSRNNNPERFYDFEQFVLPESRNITITIHDRSHRSTKYTSVTAGRAERGGTIRHREKSAFENATRKIQMGI